MTALTADRATLASPHLQQRQLLAATALVVAAHALLLFGLPQLHLASELRSETGTFITRRIASVTPAVPAESAPTAALVAAPAPKPEPVPAPVEPKPAARTHKPAVHPEARTRKTSGTRVEAAPAAPSAPSLLHLRPPGLGSFGGRVPPVPITPPLPVDATGPVLELAQSLGDVPVRIPRAAELGFQVSGRINGKAFALPVTVQWRQDGQWYESRFGFYSPPVGDHTRQSAGLITPQGLAPIVAETRMHATDAQDIRFDYDKKRVRFSTSGTEAPLVAGVQDGVSVLFQLAALLAGDPDRYPVGTAISLPAAFARGEGTWRFAVEGEEDIPALKDRTVLTVHLTHTPFDDQSPRIDVWLGRTLDFLPVRVRTTEPNGDTVEYQLMSAWAQPTPTAAAGSSPDGSQ